MKNEKINELIKLHQRQVWALETLKELKIRLSNRIYKLNHNWVYKDFNNLRDKLAHDITINKNAIIRIERYYEKLSGH